MIDQFPELLFFKNCSVIGYRECVMSHDARRTLYTYVEFYISDYLE